MNQKRILGISLVITSTIISLANLTLTGAVIGLSKTIFSLLGIVLFIAGVLLLVSREEGVKYLERDERLEKILGKERFRGLKPNKAIKYNKSLRRYEERLAREKAFESKYNLESLKLLKNEATECLARGYIPMKRDELLRLARRCGYDIVPGGEGMIIKDKKTRKKITEIGKHKELRRSTAKQALISLATGEFIFRKSAA